MGLDFHDPHFPIAQRVASRGLDPGTQVGRYVIRKKLGEGGFGAVYLATALRPSVEVYAIKHAVGADLASQTAFEREAQAWVRLGDHPFIVSAREVIRHDASVCVAMDYIPADRNGLTTMCDHIAERGHSISDTEIGNWCIQLCRGMEHATSCGLRAHRDIKPLNLLVDGWRIRITDFGLVAAAAGMLTVPANYSPGSGQSVVFAALGRGACGTPGFIAPELLEGADAGPASDIFSVGITLWQLAAAMGDLPYDVAYGGDVD